MQKPNPIYDQNGQNQLKSISFEAAQTYIAHVREYPLYGAHVQAVLSTFASSTHLISLLNNDILFHAK